MAWAEEVRNLAGTTSRVPEHEVPHYLKEMRIGSETVRDELGSSLFNRVISRTTAVAVNALTGEHAKIPVLPRVLRPLRTPIHASNSLVTWLTQASPLGRAVLAFVLAVSAAIVALAIGGADVPPGSLAIALVLLTGSMVVALLRIGFGAVAVSMLLLAAVVGLTLTGEDLESVVYSEPDTETSVSLDANSRLEIPAGTVIDITVEAGDDRIDQDVVLDGDASITLRTGEAVAVSVSEGQPFVEAWKRYGFTNPFGALRVLALLGLLALLVKVIESTPGSSTWRDFWKHHRNAVGAIALALLLIVLGPAVSDAVLTGAPGSNGLKDWFVDLAADFETYGLEVLLAAFVGITMALSLFTPALSWFREKRAKRSAGTSQ